MRSCPSDLAIRPGGHEHARLREGVRHGLQHAARERHAVLQLRGRRVEGEREHQEQVADLRHGRVGDQQLEPLLAQRQHAAVEDRRRAERRDQLRGRDAPQRRHHLEPQPDQQHERALDHQRRQHGARGRRRAGVRRRQPQVQREQRGLGEQARRHQRGGDPGRRLRLHARREQRDVERAVGAVEQHGAEQVQHRAEQREHQVAQRGGQRRGAAVEAHQRHGREGEQLERDVQVEEVVAHHDQVHRAPHRDQQRPEHQRACASRARPASGRSRRARRVPRR